jgi:hypothetical protein
MWITVSKKRLKDVEWMMKQNWYGKGYAAYKCGQTKLLPYEKGAKDFNEGWEYAQDEERWELEVEEQNKIAQELEDVKRLICNWGDELDLDALVDVLHGMGVRG